MRICLAVKGIIVGLIMTGVQEIRSLERKGAKRIYGFVPFLISLTNFSRFKKKKINTR